MRAVDQAREPWLPLHEAVGSVLRELSQEAQCASSEPESGSMSNGRPRTELEAAIASRELAST